MMAAAGERRYRRSRRERCGVGRIRRLKYTPKTRPSIPSTGRFPCSRDTSRSISRALGQIFRHLVAASQRCHCGERKGARVFPEHRDAERNREDDRQAQHVSRRAAHRSHRRLHASAPANGEDTAFQRSKCSDLNVFLLSIRAGGEGITLTAANRVVMMDVCWNPCADNEAMCRAYRYGQKKPVHVYRLVASGTMETHIYQQQIRKEAVHKTVVDEEEVGGREKKAGDYFSLKIQIMITNFRKTWRWRSASTPTSSGSWWKRMNSWCRGISRKTRF